MKKAVLLFIAVMEMCALYAQPSKYWIEFTDKNGSPYSITNPSAYLSARAIARRTKFGIAIQENDLPPNPNYIDSVVSKGVKLLNRSGWFNAISIYASDTTKLKLIRALPFVKKTTYVTVMKPPTHKTLPDKKVFSPLTDNLRVAATDSFNYGYAYWQYHMIGVDCLNNKGYRGKGKEIAVIDTRFGRVDTISAYDSIRNHGQILATWDFVWGQPKVYDTADADTHGQMVLGCMAGNLPGQYLGDAEDADYYLLRSEDVASEYMIEDDNWASAAEYADSAGADVITSSLGYTTFDDPATSYTYADMNGKTAIASMAATIASEKGMVVCVAAGNEGNSPWHYIGSPGDADSILTVGAVDYTGAYASFSSTGPTSDGRIKPDVAAMGQSAALCSPYGGVTSGSGTSFATPIIAGAVASLWQSSPNSSNFEIMKAIKESASQYAKPDSLLGYGIPNFCLANIITSTNDQQQISVLNKVYPNPFNNDITAVFFSSTEQNVNVVLYNSIGQSVYSHSQEVAANGNTLITIDGLNALPQGLYLVSITDESGKVFTGKVIKQ